MSGRYVKYRDGERTFVYLAQLALRGRGEKKKEIRIGLDLTTFTGNTIRQKSLKLKQKIRKSMKRLKYSEQT